MYWYDVIQDEAITGVHQSVLSGSGGKKTDEYESFAVTAPPGFKRQLSDYLRPNEAFCSRFHWFFHPLLFPVLG